MSESHLFWEFSKNFSLCIEAPTCIGSLSQEDEVLHGGKIHVGKAGSLQEGNQVSFYFLIDRSGIILDALFQAFGDAILIGCAESLCEMSTKKPYRYVLGVTKEKMTEFVLGKGVQKELPSKARRCISLVVEAAAEACKNLGSELVKATSHPEWAALSREEKLVFIREAIEEYVAPYLRRDGGDITVVDITPDNIVLVTFHGACVECVAFGSTLLYVQHMLQHNVYPSLTVRDNFSGTCTLK
jgi:NifU-like protein